MLTYKGYRISEVLSRLSSCTVESWLYCVA